jgi:hypothetical protein
MICHHYQLLFTLHIQIQAQGWDGQFHSKEREYTLTVTVVENVPWSIEDMYSNKCLQDSLRRGR